MPLILKTRTAVCAAALLVAAGAFAVRAQDAAPERPAETPPAAAAPESPAQTPPAAAAPAAEPETAAQPQPATDPAEVLARVGEETVTEGDLTIARQEFAGELGQVPETQQRGVLVDALINMKLLAQAARDEGLDQGPEFETRLEFLRMQALRNAYVEQAIVNEMTPEELEQGYQTLVVSQHKPEEQVRARHILVETQEQAATLIEELKGGAAFEELAKQSKDPSGQNGGDLGYFGRGQMVPPFEEAAFALEPGAITEMPVQSEFGWHVIKVEDKRMSEPPPLAEVEDELRQYLLRQKFETVMTALRDKYPVEIVGQPAPAEATEPAGEGAGNAPADAPDAPPAASGEPTSEPATGEPPQD